MDREGFFSKHRLTPHLTSYTPPYTFTPFLNPPKKSTLPKPQYTGTSQIPHQTPKYNSTSKHLPTQHQTPKHKNKIRRTALTPHLTSYTPPCTFTPFLNPPKKSTLPKPQYTGTSHIPHQTPNYNSTSKHLPTQHQTPKHKNKIRRTALTPHLTSYTPPYTFTPFLNPPKISTFQNTKTQSTSQIPHRKSKYNPKPKHLPSPTPKSQIQSKTQSTSQHITKPQSTKQNPKHRPDATSHTPYTLPYTFTPFLKPPKNSTLQTDKAQSTSQNKCNYPKHNP